MEPVILERGEGENGEGRSTKLSTDGLGVVEFDIDEDSVGDHAHDRDEVFYVLEGRMTFRVDSTSRDLESGGFVFIPRGIRHGFDHDERARYLVISSPGGLEKYFAETEEADNRGAADDELEAIARRYGTRLFD